MHGPRDARHNAHDRCARHAISPSASTFCDARLIRVAQAKVKNLIPVHNNRIFQCSAKRKSARALFNVTVAAKRVSHSSLTKDPLTG